MNILVFVESGAFWFFSKALLITKIDIGIMGRTARLRNISNSFSALQHIHRTMQIRQSADILAYQTDPTSWI